MATASQESAVRNYLVSLKDPSALRDSERIEGVRQRLDSSQDELERLQLRQELLEAEQPPLERYEEEFVTHAKAWADDRGISEKAFAAEGVPAAVLRKAGFRNVRGGRRRVAATTSTRRRTSPDEIRKAIPRGTFTIKELQDRSGASSAVVRRVVQEELEGGGLQEVGTDPDHQGPGRAPVIYQRS